MPGLHGTVKLPRIVGVAKAIDILLTGRTIEAQEALSLKLVDYVVPGKEVFDYSLDYLKKLTGDKPISVIRAVVQSFINARKLSEDKAIEKWNDMYFDSGCRYAQRSKSGRMKKDNMYVKRTVLNEDGRDFRV